MSVAVERFAPVLRQLGDALDVPHPARSRILQEIAGDLEGLYELYRARGLSDDEAAERAASALALSPEMLRALVEIHTPAYQRLFGRFSERGRRHGERAFLFVLVGCMVLGGGSVLATQDVLADPSPFLWPVLALGAVAAALALAKAFQLFVKKDHHPDRLRSGLGSLLACAPILVLIGLVGAVADLYALAGSLGGDVANPTMLAIRWLRTTADLLTAATVLALAVGLVWYGLTARVAAIERAESEIRQFT
ncbi:MAG TPA: hypothetical protein VKZ58_11395 [Longimicrobiales bacterium]|nr:hypothetical protein [Longimicrobiales bacterium]